MICPLAFSSRTIKSSTNSLTFVIHWQLQKEPTNLHLLGEEHPHEIYALINKQPYLKKP